jgi:hypothetical protein
VNTNDIASINVRTCNAGVVVRLNSEAETPDELAQLVTRYTSIAKGAPQT